MDVPVVPAARLKGDVCQKYGCLLRVRKRMQPGTADKIPGKRRILLSQAKYILFVKRFLIVDFHNHLSSLIPP